MTGVLSGTLADFAVQTSFEDLPSDAVVHARDAFQNWIGCALGGASSSTVEAAARAFKSINPEGNEVVLGRSERHGIIEAISLDCLSSATLAFDDTHLETVLHPTGPVAAALMGLARRQTVSGADFVLALSIGMEVECRVGLAVASSESGSNTGWYSTGLAGGIGAAVAVGKLLGFDRARMLNAMGLAAARASGNRGTHGSMAGQYVPSVAAESGYVAARLAEAGFTCGARALDGDRGLLQMIAPTPAIDRALLDLGRTSEAARTAFKPYPSGIITHPIIDACLELAVRHDVQPTEITSLDLEVAPTSYALGSGRHPIDVYNAQVSIAFWASVALLFRKIDVGLLEDEIIRGDEVNQLQKSIGLTVGPGLGVDQCFLTAKLIDGRTVEVRIERAVGSIERPMTRAELDTKFVNLVERVCSPKRARWLHGMCVSILEQQDVSRFLSVCEA